MNNYYVYIYWRLDINEPFYIGKGHGRRWKVLHKRAREHNKHFINIINKFPITVTIEKDNLTEQEAFYWEEKIIEILVFEYGFSIDIPGNKSNDHYCHLVNMTWGGDGTSGMNPFKNKTEEEMMVIGRKISDANKGRERTEEWKRRLSEANKGREKTEETKRKISDANKGKLAGENNPMYGIHRYGKNNPMYGKTHTEETIKKMKKAKEGKDNPMAKSVICLTTKRIFFTTKEGADFYNLASSNIRACCKGKQRYAGKLENNIKLVWMFLDEFLEKCNYIIL